MTIRIALAEDRPFLARAITQKLSTFPTELELVFHVSDGQQLLDRLGEGVAVDAILMDIEMPVMDGIAATAAVSERHPQIKVIMFTVFDDERRILEAIQAGASGYLLKDESAAVLRDSIRAIMDGGAPMSPAIATKALELLRNPSRVDVATQDEDFRLTKREVEVLEQLGHGLDYQEIAANLFISPATVRKHIENIYRKLQVNNKMRAVRKATKFGLI